MIIAVDDTLEMRYPMGTGSNNTMCLTPPHTSMSESCTHYRLHVMLPYSHSFLITNRSPIVWGPNDSFFLLDRLTVGNPI